MHVQDAFWLLLLDSNATLLHDLAHASSAVCIGVRGEVCLSGWARVTHAVGTAPLWQAPCGDECAACELLSYDTLPCMQHWEAQPSCAPPAPHPHATAEPSSADLLSTVTAVIDRYTSMYDAMSACDAVWPACVGVEYNAQGRYVPRGGFVPYVPMDGVPRTELPSGQVGFVPPDAAQRDPQPTTASGTQWSLTSVDLPRGRRAGALRRDGEPAPLSLLPPPPLLPPPLLPPPPPLPLPSTPVVQWGVQWAMQWATPWAMRWEEALVSRDERRRLESSSTLQIMYTMQGGRDLAASKVRGNVLAPEALARIREIEIKISSFSGAHLTNLDSAVPCLLGQKRAAAAAGGALAWYRGHDEAPSAQGEPSQANVRACVYGMQMADEGSSHFASDLDLSGMDGGDGSHVTCSALRSSFTFSGAADAWARTLIYELYSISGGGVEVSFYGDLFWAEFYMNLIHDVVFVVLSLLLIWLFSASVLRMPLYASFALFVVVASFPVAFAFYSGPLGTSKAPAYLASSEYT